MKPITISYSKGIQFPPKLGTLSLKPTGEGKAAYAQNIDVANDEYGNGAVVPGPALTTIDNNSALSGVPFLRQFYGLSSPERGYLYFAQGLLGTKTIIRRIKNIISGSTPSIDTDVATSMTVNHGPGHTNQTFVDFVLRPSTGTNSYIYVSGHDDTDSWVYKFFGAADNVSLSLVATNTDFDTLTDQFLVFSTFDNNIYWIGQDRVSSIDVSDIVTTNKLALGLPKGSYASCGVDWQQQLVVCYSTDTYGNFSGRNRAGRSGIVLWDYVSPSISRNIPAPCRFISVLIQAPDGQLLVFGGVDEGKSSIYSFTGYGFQLLTQYIGDMPRSRHSVEFDSQGRIVFVTADGYLCRYDRQSGIFENLGTGSSTGGLLAKGIGSPAGNEFFMGSGAGSTYMMKKVQFGSYIGDGAGADTVNTPLVADGIRVLPPHSNIQWATLNLAKPLETGERVELRIYKNGSTTDYVTYLTMDYSIDGAISSKREEITLDNINSFNAVPVWKMADGNQTAPPVLSVEVMPGTQY